MSDKRDEASEREAAERRRRAAALEALLERIKNQPVVDVGRWTRDELYDLSGKESGC